MLSLAVLLLFSLTFKLSVVCLQINCCVSQIN